MPLPNDCTLRLALEVLHMISVRLRQPDPEALLRLRELAREGFEKSLPDDELACLIVHREITLRARHSHARPATRAA
jgi:hypothetical protein